LKPISGYGKPQILLEDGGLQIVPDRPPGRSAAFFSRARSPGIGLVGPRSRNGKSREEEESMLRTEPRLRGDNLPSAAAERWFLDQEEGNIAAQGSGQRQKRVSGSGVAEEAAEGQEGGGGVAAASPQAGSRGQSLFQRDRPAAEEAERVGEEAHRPADQIVFSRREPRIVASKGDLRSGMGSDPESVAERDRSHPRRELMKPVGAAAENAQVEVDFRRSEEFNAF
jgi:hypothetical protein